jgi:hypothetical protein
MPERTAADFKNADELAAHLEKLVHGWASVIRCKAEHRNGAACGRVIMIVFRDFYELHSAQDDGEWTSSKTLLCRDCASDLKLLDPD